MESRIQLKESGILQKVGIQIPSSTDKTGVQYLESRIHGVESRIQCCLELSYMVGRIGYKKEENTTAIKTLGRTAMLESLAVFLFFSSAFSADEPKIINIGKLFCCLHFYSMQ